MKLNRKGFTLIELLAIITVLAVVSSITINVMLGSITKAKENSKNITISNIEKQAANYISENFSTKHWMQDINGEEYQCVTVDQLVDAGYFTSKIYEDNDFIKPELYIKLIRDNTTKAIKGQTLYLDYDGQNLQGQSQCPYINCVYEKPTGWVSNVPVSINYNVTDLDENKKIINGFKLNKAEIYIPDDPKLLQANILGEKYYYKEFSGNSTINDSININVIKSGNITADTHYEEGEHLYSTTCSISKIDSVAPYANIESEEMWANKDKEVKLELTIYDNETGVNPITDLDKFKSAIEVYVSNGYDDNSNYPKRPQTNKVTSITQDGNKYILKLKGIYGDGNLIVKIKPGYYYDLVDNPNKEETFVTNIKIDNTEPYETKMHTCHKDLTTCNGYYWVKDDFILFIINASDGFLNSENGYDYGSPYTKIYIGKNNESTKDKVSEFTWNNFYHNRFIYSSSTDLYIYIMDEAGNINTNGFGMIDGSEPYHIRIDKIPPTVSITPTKTNNNVTKLECNFSDTGGSEINKYYFGKVISNNEYSYIDQNGDGNAVINSETYVAAGEYICIAYDKAGNVASSAFTVASNMTYLNIDLKGYIGTSNYNGSWTNQSVTLKGTIKTDAPGELEGYAFTNASSTPTTWLDDSSLSKTDTNQTITYPNSVNEGTNDWYFHVKHANGTVVSNKITTKIDKTPPTCGNKTFSQNNSTSGVTVTIKCNDTGGSECASDLNYANIKQSKTGTIYDNAGNSNTCSVDVTSYGRRKYCSSYQENCKLTFPNWENFNVWIRQHCNYSYQQDNQYYSFAISKNDVNAGTKRCKDTSSTSPNTGLAPFSRAINIIRNSLKCGDYDPTQYLPKPSAMDDYISHSYYSCASYSSNISNGECTETDGNAHSTNNGTIYKCIRYYQGS